MGSNEILCTAHVMVAKGEHSTKALVAAIKVAKKYGIGHSTFQIEIEGEFDPTLETYGTLHGNPKSFDRMLGATARKENEHGHGHGHGHTEHGHGHADTGHTQHVDRGHKEHGHDHQIRLPGAAAEIQSCGAL